MKQIDNVNDKIFHIISEPGDMTRYDYFIFKDYEDYCIMPCKSTFRFPQRLNYWDIEDLVDVDVMDKKILDLAEKENCNPHTLKECIRTIKELQNA